MNIKAFPVGTTNLFPAANTVTGGQLLTEFNIRSRESVDTPSTVKYIIGPSYTHSIDDFSISCQEDTLGNTISSSILQISPGRAVVNGHYVESLAPVTVDMAELNYKINVNNKDESNRYIEPLTGELCVGLRMMYSTDKTIAGSILVEDENDYFEGVQVVILKSADFILPVDSPGDESKVTAHLLLGKMNFINGNISGIVQNEDKIKTVDADRIGNFDGMLSEGYISNYGLDPDKIYAYAGAGGVDRSGNVTSKSTWQDVTGSLVRWTSSLQKDTRNSSYDEAKFVYDETDDKTKLVLPLLQNARKWEIKNTAGDRIYYKDAILDIPNADFNSDSGGIVNKDFISKMKNISNKIDNFYHLTGGRLKQYIPQLQYRTDTAGEQILDDNGQPIRALPEINVPSSAYTPVSLRDYETKLGQVQGLVKKLSNDITKLTSNIDALIANTTTVHDLKSSDSDLETSISDLNTNLDDIEKKLDEVYEWYKTKEESGDPQKTDNLNKPLPKDEGAADSDDYPKESRLPNSSDGEKAVRQFMKASKKMRDCCNELQEVVGLKSNRKNLVDQGNDLITSVQKIKDDTSKLPSRVSKLESSVKLIEDWKAANYEDDIADAVKLRLQDLEDELTANIHTWQSAAESALKTFLDKKIREEYHLDKIEGSLPGDYVVVGEDFTVGEYTDASEGRNPSTMYILQPGTCNHLKYVGYEEIVEGEFSPNSDVIAEYKTRSPEYYHGVCLNSVEVESYDPPTVESDIDSSEFPCTDLGITSYRGSTYNDYFIVRVIKYKEDDPEVIISIQNYYFTPVSNFDYTWSDPIYLTKSIPYATTGSIGGFRNADPTWYGSGYVVRDDNGYLRVLDYDLLATGVLAYQLGEDATCAAGLGYDEVQSWLNDYVNYRVAFPNISHLTKYTDPDAQRIINVTVDISEWGGESEDNPNNVLTIGNIDSRFGTATYIHLTGKASQGTIIDISDVEKLILDISSLSGNYTLNLFNCELYYDPTVMNQLNQIEGLKLWYKKFPHIDEAAPNLLVSENTVELLSAPVMTSVEDFWGETTPADNTYLFALKSLKFSDTGTITDVGILIQDNSTANDAVSGDDDQMYGGDSIYASTFVIPQAQAFPYPQKLLREQIRISGAFVHAYSGGDAGGYFISDNRFTILTQTYNAQSDSQTHGTISILSSHKHVTRVTGNVFHMDEHGDINYEKIEGKNIDGWDSYGWHSFTGGLAFRGRG